MDGKEAAITDIAAGADLSFSGGDYLAAARQMAAVMKLLPADFDGLFFLGLSFLKMFRHEEAILFFKRALAVNRDARCLLDCGFSLVSTGRYSEARDCLSEALKQEDTAYEALFLSGLTAYLDKSFQEAEEALNSVVRNRHNAPDAWWWLGRVLSEQGRTTQALDAWLKSWGGKDRTVPRVGAGYAEARYPLVIGMPVYNGGEFLVRAIESLLAQSYTGWRLVISDDASMDLSPEICLGYAKADERIEYVRQEKNLGFRANFKYLLDMADSRYFMWAAQDDVWDEDFIAACLAGLEVAPGSGLAFSNMVNIDRQGAVIRDYLDLSRFTGKSRFEVVCSYLFEPEVMGKSNFIYGVYDTGVLREAVKACDFVNTGWGEDYSLVLAALCRTEAVVDKRVLFRKRIRKINPSPATSRRAFVYRPVAQNFLSIDDFDGYVHDLLNASRDTPYYHFTRAIMNSRREYLIEPGHANG